jgi:hypothetical protein
MQNAQFQMQTMPVRDNGVEAAATFTPLMQTLAGFAFRILHFEF